MSAPTVHHAPFRWRPQDQLNVFGMFIWWTLVGVLGAEPVALVFAGINTFFAGGAIRAWLHEAWEKRL